MSIETAVMTRMAAPFPSARRAWYAVCVLLAALTFSFIDRQILSLMVDPVRLSLRLSDLQISLLQGPAFLMFYAFLGMPLGQWADRHSRQRLIIAGIVVWCLATIACGFSHSFGQLFVARVFVGIGEAALGPAANSMISDLFAPEKRGRAISAYSLGIVAGTGAALILGALAIARTVSGTLTLQLFGTLEAWQAAFVMVGAPGFVVAALMMTVREPDRREKGNGTSLREAFAFLKSRRGITANIILGFALSSSLAGFAMGAWAPTVLIRVHGWAPREAAFLLGSLSLTASIAGVLVAGALGDRLFVGGRAQGRLAIALTGGLGTIPSILLVGFGQGNVVLVAAAACFYFFLGLPVPLANPVLHAITPNDYRGRISALLLLCSTAIGMAGGPVLVALVSKLVFHSDMAIGKALALVVALAAAIGIVFLAIAHRRYADYLLPELRPATG